MPFLSGNLRIFKNEEKIIFFVIFVITAEVDDANDASNTWVFIIVGGVALIVVVFILALVIYKVSQQQRGEYPHSSLLLWNATRC